MMLFRAAIMLVLLCSTLVSASEHKTAELPSPLTDADFKPFDVEKARLGQLLFYDRVLSGEFIVSCASCHNHDRGSSNGVRLDLRHVDGGFNEEQGIYALNPNIRHAPTLFNLGAREFTTLFSDGRISGSRETGFNAPSSLESPDGLDDIVALQALMPAVTREELAGSGSDLSPMAHGGNQSVWDALAARVRDLPDYWPHVQKAYPEMQSLQQLTIVDIANAIGAFVRAEWRSTNSPFDRAMAGDFSGFSDEARAGAKLFYGEAGCSGCHSGPLLTDHAFHAMGSWPWAHDADLADEDLPVPLRGRSDMTGNQVDLFKLRTPSLRNVAATAPYGHAGGYKTLEAVIEQHIDPASSLQKKLAEIESNGEPVPESRKDIIADIASAAESETPSPMRDWGATRRENATRALIAFLETLTDEASLKGRLGKPAEVPSSLVID
ncbi:MAG: cytochrome c peroxidase [Pseudomonadota bacterium]